MTHLPLGPPTLDRTHSSFSLLIVVTTLLFPNPDLLGHVLSGFLGIMADDCQDHFLDPVSDASSTVRYCDIDPIGALMLDYGWREPSRSNEVLRVKGPH